MDAQPTEREQRVTPLELFFDLVVVFAITQVTYVTTARKKYLRLSSSGFPEHE